MTPEDIGLPPHLQRLINYDINGLDIMHGELKNLMLIWEKELEKAQEIEEESGSAMDSMERKYCEGFLDSLTALYKLTYDLSFAIGIRTENRKDGHL
jgi:hypothetical protein